MPEAPVREPLAVAVVGTGGWAREHARIFSGRQDTDLRAVLGRHPSRTAIRAGEYGARPYTDLDELLATERPDLVSVCLPNEHHYPLTRRLVDTGIALLVEKPLVFDLDEADDLLAAADRSGCFFAVNFNHRYAEPFLRAKRAIDEGAIGEPVFASWRFGGEASSGTHPHANLIETQCHGFDLLEHLTGPITSVAAQMSAKTRGDYSTVALALEFENRAVGTLLGSYDSSYAYRDTQLVEINGTAGRLVVRDTVGSFSLWRAGDETEARWQAGYFHDEARQFTATFDRHVTAVLDALRNSQPPPVPAGAGRRALQLAYAAIESFETGRRVPTVP